MGLVALFAATLWGLGMLFNMPYAARQRIIGVLYIAVLGAQFVLPEHYPVRDVTGGSPATWLLIGGFALLFLSYRFGLNRL